MDSPTFYIFLNVYILVQLFFSISANSAQLEKLRIYSFQLLSFRIKLSDLFEERSLLEKLKLYHYNWVICSFLKLHCSGLGTVYMPYLSGGEICVSIDLYTILTIFSVYSVQCIPIPFCKICHFSQ